MKIKDLFTNVIKYICDKCGKEIENSVVTYGSKDYHPSCFKKVENKNK